MKFYIWNVADDFRNYVKFQFNRFSRFRDPEPTFCRSNQYKNDDEEGDQPRAKTTSRRIISNTSFESS